MITKQIMIFIFLFVAAFPIAGFAAQKKKAKKQRVVEINFDDELLIKGKLLGPSLFTLYQKRNVEFGKLIKPRKKLFAGNESHFGGY